MSLALGLEIRGGGTYHLSVATDDAHEATLFATILESLGIVFQANYPRDVNGRPKGLFLTIYDHCSQQRLLEACAEGLSGSRQSALDTLVRARGPMPEEILRRINATVSRGESYAYIAEAMNQRRIVDGMGGKGWTVKKIRAKHEAYLEQIASDPARSYGAARTA